jgi:hypothetical protein
MATPTENLVLQTSKDIEGTLSDHGRQLSALQSGENEIRGIVTALGLAAHANVRSDMMEDRLGKLEALVSDVDSLKERVTRLEWQEA